jgi:hypothetical protein
MAILDGQDAKGRNRHAIEPDECSLRVINQVLQGLTRVCKYPISKRFSLLRLAVRCTVLRSGGVRVVSISSSHPPSPKGSLCWFYDLLRKALKSANAILAVMRVVWQLQLNGCP